jgi:hypothetical protein
MASLSGPLPTMRAMCAAKDENHILIGADYKQLELWVAYAINGDEVLGHGLKTGDVYAEDAKYLYRGMAVPRVAMGEVLGWPVEKLLSLPIKEQIAAVGAEWYDAYLAGMRKCNCEHDCEKPLQHLKKKSRQDAKVGHLAFQYACELNTFYRQMLEADQDMAYSHAALLHSGLRTRYKRTVEWWYEELERVSNLGWSESRILQCRKTYPATPELQTVANWPIQTTAAEVHGLAWLTLGSGRKGRPGTLSRFGGEALLIKQWYDAFLVECRREIKDEVAGVVREAMEQSHIIEGREWRFRVDVKSGRRESDV